MIKVDWNRMGSSNPASQGRGEAVGQTHSPDHPLALTPAYIKVGFFFSATHFASYGEVIWLDNQSVLLRTAHAGHPYGLRENGTFLFHSRRWPLWQDKRAWHCWGMEGSDWLRVR